MTPPEWFLTLIWPALAVIFVTLAALGAMGAVVVFMELLENLAAARRRNRR